MENSNIKKEDSKKKKKKGSLNRQNYKERKAKVRK
jgi:hypothetical protein